MIPADEATFIALWPQGLETVAIAPNRDFLSSLIHYPCCFPYFP